MMKRCMLSDTAEGESVRIKEVFWDGDIRRRLMELGFVKGAVVKCIHAQRKNIRAYYVKGAVIAVRNRDAGCIEVEAVIDDG